MRHILKLLLPLLFLVVSAQSQQHIGQWKSFTDMKSVRSAILVDNNIWAATGGGVFVFDTTNGTFTKFTNVDGLDTNDVLSIAFDGTHYLWVGGAGGWINVYDMNAHQWQTIADIANKTESSYKGIQSFSFKGDTVFIVTDFGVSIFKRSRWEFGDTYQNLGFISPQVSCMALQQNRMWIGTDKGLSASSLGSSSWSTYNSFPGITSSAVTTLAVFNDTLVIGTSNGAAYFALHDSVPKALPLLSNRFIQEFRVVQGTLYVLSASGINFTVETLASLFDVPHIVTSNSSVQGVCLIPASSLWIATASKGLAHVIGSTWNYSYPNGPNSNFFSSIAVDEKGILWCASGETAHAGFYRYNPSLPEDMRWKNFTSDKYTLMQKNGALFDNYYNISLGVPGSIWVSSWGDGVVKVVGDSVTRKYNYYSKPRLPGAITDVPDYVVSSGVAVDNEGKTWIVNRNEANGNSLFRLDNDTTGTPFDNQFNSSWGCFHGIVIDQNDTKWMGSTIPWHMDPGNGLFFFNENTTISGTETTGGWGNISNMSDNKVLSLKLDLDGELWVGLGLGIVIIPDPFNPTNRNISFPLREQVIQSIAVDAVNNKWIGTKEGVFVVNADGTQLVQNPITVPSANPITVSSTNKSLLSNDVRTIEIDQKRGIIYFGTEQGLSSLSIAPVQTNRSYSELQIGPNPYILPNDQPLTIRNLIANSTIKILTVNGSLVTQFEAQGGGRAFWDGRDKKGAFVSSGIYFIAAFTENGSQSVIGKVAVIRK
jgi:ligand-binding sensor domain-containing protein